MGTGFRIRSCTNEMTAMARTYSARRRNRRYITLLVLFAALFGGWSWLWHYATGKAETAIDGWREREAKSGRVYTCGSQTIGGYPFRFEVNCNKAAAPVSYTHLTLPTNREV